jgi:hypothetical protein
MWQNPQYWAKRITYKQNNIGKQTKKASQIFTNNSFTTFLEGDYLLGYVLFFFTMCMLIFFSTWILAKNGHVGHHKYLTIFLQIVWLSNCMCM